MNRIARLTLCGALGFGIGTVGFGAIRIAGWDLIFLSSGSVPSILGFPTMGAIGGAALGLALRDRRKALLLASVGAISFLIGFVVGLNIGFMLGLAGLRMGGEIANSIFYGMIPGAIGGAALGLVFLNFRKGIGLALAGAIGFGIGMLIMCYSTFNPWVGWYVPGNFKPWFGWVLWGVIGGASLGATLGYLEKEETTKRSNTAHFKTI